VRDVAPRNTGRAGWPEEAEPIDHVLEEREAMSNRTLVATQRARPLVSASATANGVKMTA
jgi:hypothetical protein